MISQSITANYLKTICWNGDLIVDWVSGKVYSLDGEEKQLAYSYAFDFDSAICSTDGIYAFIYKRLGTKGVLLKNGKELREINRSYCCANVYEYPAAFVTFGNKTYLIHCPVSYNQLDLEDVETGEIVTNVKGRNPEDVFHSRLEVSADNAYILSRGWVWHPLDQVLVFDIKECLKNPLLLDRPQFCPTVGVEVCTAGFVGNTTIIIGSSDEILDDDAIDILPPKHICLWDFKSNQFSKAVKVKEDFGNLFVISANYVWDLYLFPKIIDVHTGEIVYHKRELDSGKQRSSIIDKEGRFLSIIFNKRTKQIAIKGSEKIEVLTP